MDINHLKELHKTTINNFDKLKEGYHGQCFACNTNVKFQNVDHWCDKGKTALCPHCSLDTVIVTEDGNVSNDELFSMFSYWLDEISI